MEKRGGLKQISTLGSVHFDQLRDTHQVPKETNNQETKAKTSSAIDLLHALDLKSPLADSPSQTRKANLKYNVSSGNICTV